MGNKYSQDEGFGVSCSYCYSETHDTRDCDTIKDVMTVYHLEKMFDGVVPGRKFCHVKRVKLVSLVYLFEDALMMKIDRFADRPLFYFKKNLGGMAAALVLDACIDLTLYPDDKKTDPTFMKYLIVHSIRVR